MGFLADLYTLAVAASIGAFFVRLGIILILIFAVIGVVATIIFFVRRSKAKDPYKKWIKTGKM